ncbi:hypothetical protein JD844_000164 [Phrynosoma platyrhinos]|uniref:L-amino-acid oxidase n=1 Tax=Phrynosoma platyrhinos TaxID=52577 RepID=A0ABQ7SQC4_PHRPL|nr:hypothetical protein JD844_000164 [Phrynosoma platyrhinos]
MLHAHLEQTSAKPLPVVIIGNGPSGICLSYLLSGNIPYVTRNAVHPNPILQRKLEETPKLSILDQSIEGSMFTLSQGDWMGLPDLPFKDWLSKKKRGFRNSRATAGDIVQYYQYYVAKKGLKKNFLCGSFVTSVKKLSMDSESCYSSPNSRDSSCVWNFSEQQQADYQTDHRSLFQVDGLITTLNGTQPFSLYAENVVLATGTYDSPSQLGVKGEHLPFVHHKLSALEEAVKNKEIGPMSDPILIVGAGLTAADAVLFAHHCNIPVIHAFRRRVNDPALIFNQLPKTMYPEYHKVHQMMKEQAVLYPGPYECYISLPEHHIVSFTEDRKCIFRDKSHRQKIHNISMAFVLIGSNPNLSYLPNNGMDLAVDCEQPVSSKRNPIDIEPFTYESVHEKGLYAMGPLAGDNFVRFVQEISTISCLTIIDADADWFIRCFPVKDDRGGGDDAQSSI